MISLRACSGGVKVDDKKELSSKKPIELAGIPQELVLFVSQHTGAPAKPVVKPGDLVKRGQKIAEPGGFVSASLHAPTSGKIKAIEPRYQPVLGHPCDAIIIEPDGKGELFEEISPLSPHLDGLTPEDIRNLVRDKGLVGLGGAAFPTSVKISPPKDKPIDTYLLNGVECEPYLTSDERIMVEEAEKVILGFRALMKGAGVEKGIVCIEDNKPEAVMAMKKAIADFKQIDLAVLPSRYPRGGEKQLIQAVLGREVPPPPGLPLDVGVIVSNVGTAYAVADAITTGLPLCERVVSVTGYGVKEPKNFRALVGTPVSYLLEKAGGLTPDAQKVIMGGPMMGISIKDVNVPILKGTSGIVVLTKREVQKEEVMPCVRCGKCVEVCPVRLLPVWIAAYAERGLFEDAAKYRAMDCCECGACAYECPAKRPLVQYIRLAKSEIITARKKALNGAR